MAFARVNFFGSTIRECLGWRLATRLFARHPDELMLIETHAGGGQYDCLSLYRRRGRDDSNRGHIDINLEGSLHVWPAGRGPIADREVWKRLAGGELDEIVAWCERTLGLVSPQEQDDQWPHVMAVLAQRFHGRARWRSGVLDTSGYGGGVRTERFDAMPGVADVAVRNGNDLADEPAYRFWFLVDEADLPLAAVELESASGWTPSSRRYDLRSAGQSFAGDVGA